MTELEKVDPGVIEKFLQELPEKAFHLGLRVILCVIALLVGAQLIRLIRHVLKKAFRRGKIDQSAAHFIDSFVKYGLYFVLVLSIASALGVDAASIIAVFGSAGVAIGLALQGSLANFAGGVLILLMKPFKVGDYIIENDKKCEGTVESIDIFYTKLKTYDNKIIVIPNGNITANSIVNFTAEKSRKLDITVGVSYDSDIKLVKDTLTDIIHNSSYYDKTKEMNVFVDSFQESSIRMGIRCFVNTEDYWTARWEILENIKVKFDDNNIVIPYSQIEVTVKN